MLLNHIRLTRLSVLRSSTEKGAAAVAAEQYRKRADSRYFGGAGGGGPNAGIKCNNCGMVGHKAASCTAPPMITPCHLCAGRDHEPMDCPNITCFRCGDFGHHSKVISALTTLTQINPYYSHYSHYPRKVFSS